MTDWLMSRKEYLAEQNRKVIKMKQISKCYYSNFLENKMRMQLFAV